MPNPSDYTNEGDFVSACIAERQNEHPDEDQEQSAAACYSMWKERSAATGNKIIHKTHASETEGMDFILSDASPDRFGDVIEASGWDLKNFARNPIALFNHNTDFPVGRWENLQVKDGALRGRLRLAPMGTSARIDEIRKLVDAGILRAVSVGFLPIESKPRSNSAPGSFYVKSELVETSLVSVPANPNALAIAKSLKVSDDTIKLVFAKNGDKKPAAVTRGTNGKHAETSSHRKKRAMNPLGQRITDAQDGIVKLKDQLTEHLKSIDDENPDDAATALTEELTGKIEMRQKALDALKNAEKRLATATAAASNDETNDDDKGSNANNGNGSALTIRNYRPFAMPSKKITAVDHYWRGLTVAVKHFGERGTRTILDVLRDTYGENDTSNMTRLLMSRMVTKAASIPADTVTSGWADTLVQTSIGEFITALTPYSVYPTLAAKGGSFTFGRNGTISLPARSLASMLSGAFIAQGAPIPVKQGAFTPITLTPKKMGVITTMTREITEHSTPAIEAILRNAILEDTAVAIDTILLDATAASTIRPAGLRNGEAAVGPTAGGGIAALIGDLKLLVADLISGTNGNIRSPVWIINPGDVLAISLTQAAAGGDLPFRDELAGGTLLGYPVIQTTTGTSDLMYLVDAADFITATGDTPNFSVSDQAVLHMEDTTPTAISGTGTPAVVASPTRSLWQTDTMAIRMILDINWARKRAGTVSWTQTMTWN